MWYRISGRKETKYWYIHEGEVYPEEKTLMEHLHKLLPHLDPNLDSVDFFYLKGRVQNLLSASRMSLQEILDDIKSGKLFPSYQEGRY